MHVDGLRATIVVILFVGMCVTAWRTGTERRLRRVAYLAIAPAALNAMIWVTVAIPLSQAAWHAAFVYTSTVVAKWMMSVWSERTPRD